MKAPTKPFALCIDNTGYQASLIPGKVYRILPDVRAAKDDLVRSWMRAAKITCITKIILFLSIFRRR
jgi:hypothetical protein